MISSKKLDFLMNITNTSNNTLATYISYDPSHISRIRYGKRNIPKKVEFLLPVSEYFAYKIKTDYQIKILKKQLNIKDNKKLDDTQLTKYIYQWLSEKTPELNHPIEKFLRDFSKIELDKILPKEYVDVLNLPIEEHDVSFYYGLSGKREAIKKFFSSVKQELDPQTLLLFSDEEINWISGNMNFVKKWSSFLEQTISDGNKLIVIHTATTDLNEKFNTISKWIPLYITGVIEPYFYPKQNDSIYKRLLFIAPKTVALTSSEIKTQNSLNFLITNKTAINTLKEEYYNYLELCEPFIYIFTPQKKNSFEKFFKDFNQEKNDSISSSSYFSPVVIGIQKSFINNSEINLNNFEKDLIDNNYTEILSLPNIDTLKTKDIFELPIDICCDGPYEFTKTQYIDHLKTIISLLEKYEKYHVLLNINTNENCIIYSKKEIGTIITRKSIPSIIFAIKEPEMNNLFWNYLSEIKEDSQYKKKEDVINKIKEAVTMIQS